MRMGFGALRVALALVALALSATAAIAENSCFITGNTAHQRCAIDKSWCIAFATGVTDTALALDSAVAKVCPPNGVTGGQLMDLFIKALNDQPEQRHVPAAYLMLDALTKTFPCR